MTALPASLVLVGAGKMGGALLQGWLALGLRRRAHRRARSLSIARTHCARCRRRRPAQSPAAAIAAPDVLVLAVKPQILRCRRLERGFARWRGDARCFDHGGQDHRRHRRATAAGQGHRARHAQYCPPRSGAASPPSRPTAR